MQLTLAMSAGTTERSVVKGDRESMRYDLVDFGTLKENI